jgi:immune inhibitor A
MALAAGLAWPSAASPPNGDRPEAAPPAVAAALHKSTDRPAERDYQRLRARRTAIESQDSLARTGVAFPLLAETAASFKKLTKAGADKVLVILVEFDPSHSDTFAWTPGVSTWDPLGLCNPSEWTGLASDIGNPAASTNLAEVNGITQTTSFTYAGPLHNEIARPSGYTTATKTMIWTPDFNAQWYSDLIFGNGVKFQYTRESGSVVNEDFTGSSVRKYYEDLSAGRYTISGTVVGWLKLPHSVTWYGADPCPGSRSGVRTATDGGIPGAGSAASLVRDSLDAVKAAYPTFDWASYDQDKDGVIDRLWIIHAGLGEEDNPDLLAGTDYGENGMWSHSSSLSPAYTVTSRGGTTVKAGPYIMMPENCGISVLAHEYGHNLGADDLYAYGNGYTSAGMWTLMSDSWTGYPIGYLPQAFDPWHLDNWGWLDPMVVSDPSRIYKLSIGQASAFPGGSGVYRGARIPLPDGHSALAVHPTHGYEWYGGGLDTANGMMTLKTPVAIPAAGATLSASMAWDTETDWDFLWVQASVNGTSWTTLTNSHTTTEHSVDWIGGNYGFPQDLAAAGIAGFTGRSASWPNFASESFDLSAFAGKSVYLRFWYMTDWGTVGLGAFVDGVKVQSGSSVLFSDQATAASSAWTLTAPWIACDGTVPFSHNLYLQWRNVSSTGGYDRTLGDNRWYYGPANTGLLVWYNNNFYSDNEVFNHLTDAPGFGPKGRMLVVDAHPEPYRNPSWVDYGYANEAANLPSRSLMRDAPFSLDPSVGFTYSALSYEGRPAAPDFSDSQGYYPGAEYVSRGPGYSPPSIKWITQQWDSSVVMPSTANYGIRAPGYTASTEFRYCATPYGSGLLSCYWYPGGLGYDGSNGNPSEVNGQYGWNARVLSQTPSVGTVVVWNSAAPPPVAAPDTTVKPAGAAVTVPAPGVLANDSGPTGWKDVSTAELAANAAHGAVIVNPDGGYSYTPTPGYKGYDSFQYRIKTAYGVVSAAATVTLRPRGDANLDGQISAADARLALQWAGGLSAVADPAKVMAADLTGDGKVDLRDVVGIVRLSYGG